MVRQILLFAALTGTAVAGSAETSPPAEAAKTEASGERRQAGAPKKARRTPVKPHRIDHSGRAQRGEASYYSRRFAGKTMANGKPMNPNANVAASKTLPLGTKARVKNLETGKSTVVQIEDRGPYVEGRVVDLSPKAARQIGIGKEEGVAPVKVEPITVPQPDGSVKPGAGAKGGDIAPPASE